MKGAVRIFIVRFNIIHPREQFLIILKHILRNFPLAAHSADIHPRIGGSRCSNLRWDEVVGYLF